MKRTLDRVEVVFYKTPTLFHRYFFTSLFLLALEKEGKLCRMLVRVKERLEEAYCLKRKLVKVEVGFHLYPLLFLHFTSPFSVREGRERV